MESTREVWVNVALHSEVHCMTPFQSDAPKTISKKLVSHVPLDLSNLSKLTSNLSSASHSHSRGRTRALGKTYQIGRPMTFPESSEISILETYSLQSVARDLLPKERVHNCLRILADRLRGTNAFEASVSHELAKLDAPVSDGSSVSKRQYAEWLADRGEPEMLAGMKTQISASEEILARQLERIQADYDALGKVSVYHHPPTQKTFYQNLARCGSVWHCPVCAAKITERRRIELTEISEAGLKQGYSFMLLTLTTPHKKTETLSDLLEKFSNARKMFSTSKMWRRFQAQYGVVGRIRGLEVTHGAHGWHVHTHEVLVLKTSPSQMPNALTPIPITIRRKLTTTTLTDVWADACLKAGLKRPKDLVGLDLKDCSGALTYVSKWGTAHELTKSHVKKARGILSKTPFDFLRDVLETGSEDSASLFQEYATHFKGKRQLVFSPGLKEMLRLAPSLSDEELLEEPTEEAVLLAQIPSAQWSQILKASEALCFKRTDLRGLLLVATKNFGIVAINDFITECSQFIQTPGYKYLPRPVYFKNLCDMRRLPS